ncbi:MAG: GAF domain-containing sensor histidine kinase [Chloroflexia bacterium]|nr:GAF domain-containing sensor histidine kinase [Chloroflexia bacterium]
MRQEYPSTVPAPSRRIDWILLITRWSMALALLLWNHFSPPAPEAQTLFARVLLFYLGLTLLEALFLWRGWGLAAWPYVTLSLDLFLLLLLIFLSGKSNSPLLLLLLLPVAVTSLRLGFYSGLGINLLALLGYILLTLLGVAEHAQQPNFLEMGLFAGVIIAIAVFGGLIAEQMLRLPRQEVDQYKVQLQRAEEAQRAIRQRADAFYEMSHTLSVTMSYQAVLEGILRQCRGLLDFAVGVVLLSAGEEDLYMAVSAGVRTTDVLQQVHLCGGALSNCLRTAEPNMLENLGRDDELAQITSLQRCRSGMVVPLRAGLRNYGAIVLGSMEEKAYRQTDMDQLSALAHFATTAIQNAQLYQDLREERDKIIRAEEEVRKELSRDLHDGPAQSLAAMAMNVEYIKRLVATDLPMAIGELDSLEQLARRTAWDIRTMLFELRPIILETKGLMATLEQYVQRFTEADGFRVHFDAGGFDRRLDPKVENTIFIIMQEAVNNARKHAKARNIWLRLQQQDQQLLASVQDDGVGFDLDKVQSSYEARGSFGLLNMHERAQRVGGKTEIRSQPGKGTAVIISVPLSQA